VKGEKKQENEGKEPRLGRPAAWIFFPILLLTFSLGYGLWALRPDKGASPDAGVQAPPPPIDAGQAADLPFGERPADKNFNPGWIGSPCEADSECPYEGGRCLRADEGFPGGVCSLRCERLCPDQRGARYAPTFCVESQVKGLSAMCVSQCNLHLTRSGCRPGYVCTSLQRREARTTRLVCLPDLGSPPPSTACSERLDKLGLIYARPDLSDAESRAASPGDPLPRQGVCQLDTPILLASPLMGVDFRAKELRFADHMLVACAFAEALSRLAGLLAEEGVVEVEHNGTYVCRGISGSATLSGHGRGLAIDVEGFERAVGSPLSVLKDARGKNKERRLALQKIIRRIRASKIFDKVLGPSNNAAHLDHLHLEINAPAAAP